MKAHLSLYVSDIQASTEFYSRFFGVEAIKVKADYAKFELADPAWVLSLVQNPERVQSGFGHTGIVVESKEAVTAWKKAVIERGLKIALEEEQTRCCYALQDKFWVHDPDGLQWEVYTFHEDSEWNDPNYANESAQEKPNAVCCPQ